MPRLNHSTYCLNYQITRNIYSRQDSSFIRLTPTEQWALHDYYQPSKVLTDDQLRAHRIQITKINPSLPHRAGKAFTKLRRMVLATRTTQAEVEPPIAEPVQSTKRRYRSNRDRHIWVAGEVNPEIDMKRFAEVLLDLAKEMAQKEAV